MGTKPVTCAVTCAGSRAHLDPGSAIRGTKEGQLGAVAPLGTRIALGRDSSFPVPLQPRVQLELEAKNVFWYRIPRGLVLHGGRCTVRAVSLSKRGKHLVKPHSRRKLLKVASGVLRLTFTHSFLQGGQRKKHRFLSCRRRNLWSQRKELSGKPSQFPAFSFPLLPLKDK